MNIWIKSAKIKNDFPIDSIAIVEDTFVQVIGYLLQEGMIQVMNAMGKEFDVYPEEAILDG